MANTYVDYTGADGTGTDGTDFNFSFEYLRDAHVKVKVNGVETSAFTIVTSPVQLIRFNTAPAASAAIKIYRDSRGDFSPLVDFVDGSILTENELDEGYKHNLFLSQEASEGQGGEQLTKKGLEHYDAEGNKIINLFAPSDNTDAANKAYVDQTIDNSIALGGSPAIVSLGGYDVTALGSSEPRSLANRYAEVFNVMDYGAYNDGTNTAATTTAIMAAFAAAQANGSGSIVFPAGTYSITESPVLESPDSYDPSQNIGPFSISGYGATIDMGASYTEPVSPINGLLKSGILIAGVTNITVSGLTFQGTGTSLSTATTPLRYNVLTPGHKGSGMRIQGYKQATVKDCTFNGLNLGIVINDDDPRGTLPIPADKSIDSGIYNISNNRFTATWQAMSFTYGGNHEGTIIGNYIEECVTKIIGHYGNSKTDNQLSSHNHVITNNIWKNCPNVILGLNNTVFSNNVLDTVIGGIWVNPGSDLYNTDFNYDIVNLTIDSNVFNYTNTWTTTSESNMVPVTALWATIDATYAAGQTSLYKNIKFTNNSIRTGAEASIASGTIQLSTTNAKSTFENLTIANNDITITSDDGVFVFNDTVSADIQFNLSTKIIGNSFRRGEGVTSGGGAGFEFTLANKNVVAGATTSVLQIVGNSYNGSTATNAIFNLQRFSQCILNDNQLYVGEVGATYTPVFRTLGCPRIKAHSNYVVRNSSLNRGLLIGFGNVDTNDQSLMEEVRIQTRDNTMTRGINGVFPIESFVFASGNGLIESSNDIMRIDPSIQWVPSVVNLDVYCVVNPTTRDLSNSGAGFISHTAAANVVPVGYSVKTRLATAGDATGFRLGSSGWLTESTLS